MSGRIDCLKPNLSSLPRLDMETELKKIGREFNDSMVYAYANLATYGRRIDDVFMLELVRALVAGKAELFKTCVDLTQNRPT